MMLRWSPPSDRHQYLGLAVGDTVAGPLDAHPEHLHGWLVPVEGFSVPGPSAPASKAKPAPTDEPAPVADAAPQAERPDLSGLHWRRVRALSDGMGYDGDDRTKAARLAWLDSQPAADVAAALDALED